MGVLYLIMGNNTSIIDAFVTLCVLIAIVYISIGVYTYIKLTQMYNHIKHKISEKTRKYLLLQIDMSITKCKVSITFMLIAIIADLLFR